MKDARTEPRLNGFASLDFTHGCFRVLGGHIRMLAAPKALRVYLS